MILMIVASLLVVGIAWYQARQGLFTTVIMAVCTTLAAVVAMLSYRAVAEVATLYLLQPTLAEGISLTVLFCLLLFVLRILADRLIPSDIHFPLWAEWGLGGLFGLAVGILSVGVLLVVVQLLPVGGDVMGLYKPFDESLQRDQRLLPFCPDDVVAGLGAVTGAGSLSAGDLPAGQADLLRTAFCRRNTAGLHGRVGAQADGFALGGVYPGVDENVPQSPLPPARTETKVLVVRVSVNAAAANDDTWWRLPGTQFALACDDGTLYYPVAYLLWDNGVTVVPAPAETGEPQLTRLLVQRPLSCGVYGEERYTTSGAKKTDPKIPEGEINLHVDWVYRIPAEAEPQAVIFRGTARAEIERVAESFPVQQLSERMLKTRQRDVQDGRIKR
jgi:hypothetical protein